VLFIDGEFVPASSGRSGSVTEKATGRELGRYAQGDAADVAAAVAAARRAQPAWAALAAPERAEFLHRLADELHRRFNGLVEQSMRETGGIRSKAEDEVGTSIRQLQIFGRTGDRERW